jgi:hypothetical protein
MEQVVWCSWVLHLFGFARFFPLFTSEVVSCKSHIVELRNGYAFYHMHIFFGITRGKGQVEEHVDGCG